MAAGAPADFADARESVETATSPDDVINYSCVETELILSGKEHALFVIYVLTHLMQMACALHSTTILA